MVGKVGQLDIFNTSSRPLAFTSSNYNIMPHKPPRKLQFPNLYYLVYCSFLLSSYYNISKQVGSNPLQCFFFESRNPLQLAGCLLLGSLDLKQCYAGLFWP